MIGLIHELCKSIQGILDGTVVVIVGVLVTILNVHELITYLDDAIHAYTVTNIDIVFIHIERNGILIVEAGSF